MAVRPLWKSETIEVVATRWDPAAHARSRDGFTGRAVVEFMLYGAFSKASPAGRVVGDANTAVMFDAGETFTIGHGDGGPNAGLSIRIAPQLLGKLRGRGRVGRGHAGSGRISRVHVAAPVHLAKVRLWRLLGMGELDNLEAESAILSLLASALAPQAHGGAQRNPDRLVGRAKEYVNAHLDERITLSEVAAHAGCSPWHLCRMFGAATGCPLHRYVTRLRLRRVLGLRLEGRRDLTALALDCGFCSHSHMTNAFRHEFGFPPTVLMRELIASGRSEKAGDLTPAPSRS